MMSLFNVKMKPLSFCRNLQSGQWSERKEGLLQLQFYVTNIKTLSPMELRRVTEIFTRMFHDPHAKVR